MYSGVTMLSVRRGEAPRGPCSWRHTRLDVAAPAGDGAPASGDALDLDEGGGARGGGSVTVRLTTMGSRERGDYARMFQEKAVIDKRQMAIERRAGSPRAGSPRAGSPTRRAGDAGGGGAGLADAGLEPPPPPPTHVITLNHAEHLDSTLYRFEKGSALQFVAGPSLLGRKVFLYTNYVVTDNPEDAASAEFVRNQYNLLPWWRARDVIPAADEADEAGDAAGGAELLGSGLMVTDTDMYCELPLRRAGVFHFYFVYESTATGLGPAGSGFFHVAPSVSLGGVPLPLAGLTVQTVVSKCLGPFSRWEAALAVSRDAGYNAVHFTPVQTRGGSDSAYSLADQLRLDPQFRADLADLANLLHKMRNEWHMLSFCDVVLNHTANESSWLWEHPEAAYSCANTPRLRAAALLDAALARLGAAVARGVHAPAVPAAINTEEHLEALRHMLSSAVVPELRLHELYSCDVDALVQEFTAQARRRVPPAGGGAGGGAGGAELRLVQDPQYRRLKSTVDMDLALQLYNVYWADCYDEEARVRRCAGALRARLDALNQSAAADVQAHLAAAVNNVIAGIRYHYIQADGPKLGEVSEKNLFVPNYFTWPVGSLASGAASEEAVWGAGGARVCAHNGWVMNIDPLLDFANETHVYLRRELIAWGDSVKLRYGSRAEDSPFLWAHMREYVEQCAELFDGLRLDNCHSTPLHVAEYLMDCARNVKPELLVAAELFTASELTDHLYVNRLGITMLIREAQSAWDATELGRQVHRFSSAAVGSFTPARRRAARAGAAPALLLDLTHDNPPPAARRSVQDALPTAALAAAAAAASGSTRGYDQLLPYQVDVVSERRLYPAAAAGELAPSSGISAAKRALNLLHTQLARDGYTESYVDQMDSEVVAVTRHAPHSRHSVIVVAYTAFQPPAPGARRRPPPLRFQGRLVDVLLEAELRDAAPPAPPAAPAADLLVAPVTHELWMQQRVPLAASALLEGSSREGDTTVLTFRELRPGSVLALHVAPLDDAAAALRELAAPLDDFRDALRPLSLAELNVLLYRCEEEERAAGGGAYEVPGHGALVYAGLAGAGALLADMAARQDLAHPLAEHLRAGDWLGQYLVRRLQREPALLPAAAALRAALAPLARLPRYLQPCYFERVVGGAARLAARAALARMSGWVRGGCSLTRALALTSVQMVGAVPGADLPPPSPALPPPRPPSPAPTLSAGLPYFTAGYMRCWGRDTFIALPGLLLHTGRHQEARWHLVGFAACVRHGLVPNLLNGGAGARYNCRDAVWWWLRALQLYCDLVPQGYQILQEPVARLFPTDEATPQPPGAADQPLQDAVQEALDRHFQGVVFRERDAGRGIDAHMTDRGFNIQIGIHPETGFPFGGNDANAGTWMDKMGSSDAAGTRGRPATPRDGSAVELVALAHATARWLARAHAAGHYRHAGVARAGPRAAAAWTWAQWAERIERNFEKQFWIGSESGAGEARPDLVHRRLIYKDSVGASQPWADYQLRCNYVVAMAVSPALFSAARARAALDSARRLLLGPLGLKTLDPDDWAYCGHYDNDNNSADPKVAHGFNYHQGPEWCWLLGYYLRARLALGGAGARAEVRGALGAPLEALLASPWRGVPELTQAGGAPCPHACPTQAWSSATLLEALFDLSEAERSRPLPSSD